MWGHEYHSEQPLCLPVKILSVGSCEGGSKVNVLGGRGCIVGIGGSEWAERILSADMCMNMASVLFL